MNELGKAFVIIGVVLVLVGAFLWLGPKVSWLGKLPGDIQIERPHFKFYFPLTTCIIISLVLTLVGWLLRRH